jgi:hypothetical protein
MLRNIGINHLVALLGIVLAVCSYLALKRYGAPDKVCVGGSILCILVVSIFWSCVLLGADDDEE